MYLADSAQLQELNLKGAPVTRTSSGRPAQPAVRKIANS